MFDSHLHYLLEKQRHEMERRQARDHWLRQQLMEAGLRKGQSPNQGLPAWLVTRLSQWNPLLSIQRLKGAWSKKPIGKPL